MRHLRHLRRYCSSRKGRL